MSIMVAVARVRSVAASLAAASRDNAGKLADQVLHPQKHPPASTPRLCMSNLLNLIEIFAVALALHVVAMDEPERRGMMQ